MRWTIVLAGGLALATAAAVVELSRGFSYPALRERLVALGYRPVPFGRPQASRCSGASRVCDAYPEARSCGPTESVCRFVFAAPDGRGVVVRTSGRAADGLWVAGTRRLSRKEVALQRAGAL